jgi:hypothetical protein
MTKPNFSLDDFKKWMKEPKHFSLERKIKSLEGTLIESKISEKKLSEKMIPEEGEADALAKDFFENGGIINEVNDTDFLVKVDSGLFYIARKYVKKT